MLAVAEVHTYYGGSPVLHGVSLDVQPGEIVAILGRNGMGKTTLIRSVIGFTPPRHGRVRFRGDDVTGWAPFRRVGRGMALVPQGPRGFGSLTLREDLDGARGRAGRSGREGGHGLFP